MNSISLATFQRCKLHRCYKGRTIKEHFGFICLSDWLNCDFSSTSIDNKSTYNKQTINQETISIKIAFIKFSQKRVMIVIIIRIYSHPILYMDPVYNHYLPTQLVTLPDSERLHVCSRPSKKACSSGLSCCGSPNQCSQTIGLQHPHHTYIFGPFDLCLQ